MKPMETLWKEYQKQVVCKQEVSKSEMHLAEISFYAGCISLYSLLMTKAGDEEFSPEEGHDLLDEIGKEQLEFTVDILLRSIKSSSASEGKSACASK